jgi:hypothetical protein
VLAGAALAAPQAAEAAVPSGNLVTNPGAESGQGDGTAPPPSWTTTGGLTDYRYGTTDYPTPAVSDAIKGGDNFFSGGYAATSTGEQVFDVTGAASEIDAGRVSAGLSGYLGGFLSHSDDMLVAVAFLAQTGDSLGSATIGPVTPADRANKTTLLLRATSAAVPAGTRSIRLTLTATRTDGASNDGYADNISLTLVGPPVLGTTGNAEPERGRVLVKLPGRKAFIRLEAARQVPVGTVFDTTKGAAMLTTAANSAGTKADEGVFSGGRFSLGQTRKNPLTTISMAGGALNGCKAKLPKGGARKPGVSAAAKRRRTLVSDVKGRFRIRGRHAWTTARGATWRVTDTCAGTLTTVQRGSVRIFDLVKKRKVTRRAGQSYLARRGNR